MILLSSTDWLHFVNCLAVCSFQNYQIMTKKPSMINRGPYAFRNRQTIQFNCAEDEFARFLQIVATRGFEKSIFYKIKQILTIS